MFGNPQPAPRQDTFSFELGDEGLGPPGKASVLIRTLSILSGGLLAAVSILGAIGAAADAFEAGAISADAVVTLATLTLAFVIGIYLTAYGYSGDERRARRLTGKVLLWTAIAIAVIAAVALAGGFSWDSDDSDSDSGGGESGSGGDGSSAGHHWTWWGSHSGGGSDSGPARGPSTANQPASMCLSCGARMASAGGMCAGCAYQWQR
jgi:hypothetical protein